MTEIVPREVEDAVEEFAARLSALDAGGDGDASVAYEAALKRLMTQLIEKDGWLAEEFSRLARSLGAY